MKLFSLPAFESRSPGYTETRRALLVGASAALTIAFSSPGRLLAAMDESLEVDKLQQFLDDTLERALQLKADAGAAGQDAYVGYIERAVTSISDVSRISTRERY